MEYFKQHGGMYSYFTIFSLLAYFTKVSYSQNYGESCNEFDQTCDNSQHLICDLNILQCICENPEDTYFDGRICRKKYGIICVENGQPCPINGYCNLGICKCNEANGYEPNSNGKCFLPYEAYCQHLPDNCDIIDGFMQCGLNTNQCECRIQSDTVYNPMVKRCELLVNASCGESGLINGQECAINSICSNSNNNKCQCLNGFQPNKNRQCFLPYGENCFDNFQCDSVTSWQQCDRTCKCINPLQTIYDPAIEECRLFVDAECQIISNAQKCTQNSVCNNESRLCTCLDNFEADYSVKMCYLPYNSTCDPNLDYCNTNKYMECNTVGNKCSCTNSELAVLDPNDQVCKLRAESPCSDTPFSQDCVAGALCVPTAGTIPRRCKCQFNLRPNREGFCYLPYGQQCDVINNKCDPLSNLICHPMTYMCTCKDLFWFDGDSCKAHLHDDCNNDDECPNNAICELGQCKCGQGYEENEEENDVCHKSYGTDCSNSSECNMGNNLICFNGKCSCCAGYLEEGLDLISSVKCSAGYQMDCSENTTTPCSASSGLTCLGGRCNCAFPLEQVFQDRRCRGIVNSRCHLIPGNGTNLLICINNATCWQTNNEVYGICACNFGFKETANRTCVATSMSNSLAQWDLLLIILVLIGFVTQVQV